MPAPGGPLKRSYTSFHYLIHAPHFIRLFWRLLKDKRVGWLPKLILLAGIASTILPLDLIPVLPLMGLGYLGDMAVLYVCARLFIRLCPRHVVEEHIRLIDEGR